MTYCSVLVRRTTRGWTAIGLYLRLREEGAAHQQLVVEREEGLLRGLLQGRGNRHSTALGRFGCVCHHRLLRRFRA